MKKMNLVAVVFLLVFGFVKNAYSFENQVIESVSNINSDVPEEVVADDFPTSIQRDKKDTIETHAQQMPQFVNGGDKGLVKFIAENTKCPQNTKVGEVNIRIVVTKDGSVKNAEIIKGIDNQSDKEALRVVSLLPKFTPAKQDGKLVNVWYFVIVPFKPTK